MIPATRKTLRDRLDNGKFEDAAKLLEQDDEPGEISIHDSELIKALAQCLGNSGWIPGNIGDIVNAAVDLMLGPDETG